MLSALPQIAAVTPWQVIEEALARMRPPRNKEWLAQKLSAEGKPVTPQGVGNWKVRGVPPGRFIELGEILGLTARQVAALDPLPWDKSGPWPFPDIDPARFASLNATQVGEIQGEVRKMLEKFEREAHDRVGKIIRLRPRRGQTGCSSVDAPARIYLFPVPRATGRLPTPN